MTNKHSIKYKPILLIITGILFITGCDLLIKSTPLEGTQWVLVGWSNSTIAPEDFRITAQFNNGEISGQSAINSYGGNFSAYRNGDFSVSQISSTLMAGEEPAMQAEQVYFELLSKAAFFTIRNQVDLFLYDSQQNELLVYHKTP